MIKYDSAIIYGFAEKLYARANGTIVSYALFGALGGFGVGTIASSVAKNTASFFGPSAGDDHTLAIVGAVILGCVGLFLGVEKAFQLKLQAQLALCQVQIEENTRAGVGVPSASLLSSMPTTPASRPAV